MVHLCAEKADRFGARLVNGLVEANDVFDMRALGLTIVRPQTKNAGAQRTVLRGQLVDVEPALRPQKRMRLGSGLRGANQFGSPAQ